MGATGFVANQPLVVPCVFSLGVDSVLPVQFEGHCIPKKHRGMLRDFCVPACGLIPARIYRN